MPKRVCLRLATIGLVLGLVACGGDPGAALRSDVAAITDAANARDAADLRARVADLELTLAEQVARGELDQAEADRIRALAVRVVENAQALQQPPAPPAEQEVSEPAAPDPSPEGKPDEPGKRKGKGKGGD